MYNYGNTYQLMTMTLMFTGQRRAKLFHPFSFDASYPLHSHSLPGQYTLLNMRNDSVHQNKLTPMLFVLLPRNELRTNALRTQRAIAIVSGPSVRLSVRPLR